MVLLPTAMAVTMLGRATGMGLIDQPPNFALSRLYDVIAKGVTTTLLNPLSRLPITVSYTGLGCIPPCTATALGVLSLDPDRFQTAVTVASLFVGPFSVPFFFGIAGIVDYFAPTVTLLDLFPATGSGGNGVMLAGGLAYISIDFFDNMKSEAASEDLMVVNLTHLGGNPLGMIPDPTTGAPLSLGDLFVQSNILLQAIAAQLTIELAFANQPTIPSIGPTAVPPPLVGVPTITTLVL